MSAQVKRAAPDAGEAPEAKKPAPASSAPTCSWGASSGGGFASVASTGGCSWGSGSGGACSWGSGASTSFAAIASSGTGFGSAAAAGEASCGGGFGTSATTFSVGSPTLNRAVSHGAESTTPTDEPPSTVEAACTGEEDEICVHRVRAKLFRLEVRMERPRPSYAATADSKSDEAPPAAKEGSEEAVGADAADEAAGEAGASPAAVTQSDSPAVKEGSASTLNPNAKPFVPAAADAADAKSGGEGEEGEEGDDEEEDRAARLKKEAEAEEEAGVGEPVETTRWAERGVGQVRLLVHKGNSGGEGDPAPHPRMVMRVEHVGRLILNEALPPSTAPAVRASDTSIRMVVSAADGPQSFLLRVKTTAEAEQLLARINGIIPKASKQR